MQKCRFYLKEYIQEVKNMCKDQQSPTTKMRPITKEDALAHIEWLKNGGRDVLADHIFIDYFKAKTPKEDNRK